MTIKYFFKILCTRVVRIYRWDKPQKYNYNKKKYAEFPVFLRLEFNVPASTFSKI